MSAINLDFRPENDVNGHFYLRVINLKKEVNINTKNISYDGDWENLHYEFISKNSAKIVK